jgi:hypothetical protein
MMCWQMERSLPLAGMLWANIFDLDNISVDLDFVF